MTTVPNKLQDNVPIFSVRFWRCYRILHFIACRVLGGSEQAEEAIERCWLAVSGNSPQFKYEAEFRSWLLRVLIDEALALRRENERSLTPRARVNRSPQVFRNNDVRHGKNNGERTGNTNEPQMPMGTAISIAKTTERVR